MHICLKFVHITTVATIAKQETDTSISQLILVCYEAGMRVAFGACVTFVA